MTNSLIQESSLININLLLSGGPIGVSVIVTLALLSVITWVIVFFKWFQLRKFYKCSEEFMEIFWEAKSLSDLSNRARDYPYSPAREIFRAGYNETLKVIQIREKNSPSSGGLSFETVKRSLVKASNFEESRLFSNLNFLSVCASTGPFIGLFGTVVGIIKAFQGIALSGSSSLSSVAPGISEALIATALGLVVAIPSAVFYNVFSSKISYHMLILEGFGSDFLNIIERHFNIGRSETSANTSE